MLTLATSLLMTVSQVTGMKTTQNVFFLVLCFCVCAKPAQPFFFLQMLLNNSYTMLSSCCRYGDVAALMLCLQCGAEKKKKNLNGLIFEINS